MHHRTWFTADSADPDLTATATIMDDLTVDIGRSGLVTINGPIGGTVTFDFQDALAMLPVLTEAVMILREYGWSESRG